ncbi:MAG TPA: hypothetical protein PL155_09485 [Candidatus Omnitrophota bacterium]|nr:hypothetical protein [Candidatus Omnitrophota bacterium]HPD85668.1 hypothetical protein [Candidatus Omnitrophota bacterium]HRZ04511.1 hypothetical protein [Candidatus Omnitrophota bacterium]
MKRFIDVHTGEVVAGQGEVVLKSDTRMACLVIAAYDSARKVGGLAHARLAVNGLDQNADLSNVQDPSRAIDEMITDMTLLGARRDDIEVCLVTGENFPPCSEDAECCQNINSTVDLLKKKCLRFSGNARWDRAHSHVSLDVESGNIVYA